MTLRLRRKRPITAPSTLPKKPLSGIRRGLLAAALFGATLTSAPYARAEEIPQRIQVDDARPIGSAANNPAGIQLQWRSRRDARASRAETANATHADAHVVQAVSEQEISDSVELNGPQVRNVADRKAIKPIEDPFGDRQPRVAQREESSILVAPSTRKPAKVAQEPPRSTGGAFQPNPIRSGAPASAAPSLEPGGLAPPPAGVDPNEPSNLNPPMPAKKQPAPLDDLSPRPALPNAGDIEPAQPAPPEGTPLPRLRSTPKQQPGNEAPAEPTPAGPADKADCDKVYNHRNCCAEGEECHRAWKRLSEEKIGQISLDIAASYRPDINDDAEVNEKRKEMIAKVPSHLYTDRSKRPIAEGQLTNLSHGFVAITTADGQVKRVRFNDLSSDDLCFVASYWGIPDECTLADEPFEGRSWIATNMTWKASALCHKPLYFEEVQLERYGHDAGPIAQPFLSAAHFFVTIPILPYEMGMNPPNECQYALGYYRPGSCAPWMLPAIPLSARGAACEAGAALGLIYILP